MERMGEVGLSGDLNWTKKFSSETNLDRRRKKKERPPGQQRALHNASSLSDYLG
jgi:hypothetical protein